MKINPKKIIKNPTFKNLTEYVLESASRFIAEAGRIPTVFWCVGHRGVMAIEFPDSTDGVVLEKCFEQCAQMCMAELAKANMVLMDSAVTDHGTPNQTASIVVELPGLQVIYLYSIVQDQSGKIKLGKLISASEVMRVNQQELQFIPVGVPSPIQQVEASMAAFGNLKPSPDANWTPKLTS